MSVFAQPYHDGPKAGQIEHDEVDNMLTEEVIEHARSEFAILVGLVPEPDGSLSFCVDYRRLSAIAVKSTHPLPRVDESLDSLGDARFCTTLDCNSVYWQIPVAEADKAKTAFTVLFNYSGGPLGFAMHRLHYSAP